MIHVVTVHWADDRWVDVQLSYLQRHIGEPFKVYAFLNHLRGDHRRKFFYSSTEDIRAHAVKLNLLGDMAVLHSTNPADWLVFIDCDAFPIADVVAYGREKLKQYPLAAVQRRENLGDVQPHPAFCLTTVGFWKEIAGDWKQGFAWENDAGRSITDVGGNLLGILRKRGIDWFPMLRSNKRNLHPLWYGIYDDLVYHHGAGSRMAAPHARIDFYLNRIGEKTLYRKVVCSLPCGIGHLLDPIRRVNRRNQVVSERVFASIVQDPFFYQYFQEDACA
ncbi:MAG: hypothetical protein ACLQNE_42140 [Thermoguttaceae bacterium]